MIGAPPLPTTNLKLLVTIEPGVPTTIAEVSRIAERAGLQVVAPAASARAGATEAPTRGIALRAPGHFLRLVGPATETAEVVASLRQVAGVLKVVPEPSAGLPLAPERTGSR